MIRFFREGLLYGVGIIPFFNTREVLNIAGMLHSDWSFSLNISMSKESPLHIGFTIFGLDVFIQFFSCTIYPWDRNLNTESIE